MRIKHEFLRFGKKLLKYGKKYPNLSCLLLYFLGQVSLSLYFHYPKLEYGKVIKVIDGDTVVFISEKNEKKVVRLLYIDAPEMDQVALDIQKQKTRIIKTGELSKKYLQSLVNTYSIKLKLRGVGTYGRNLGILYKDKKNLNFEMIRAGMASIYKNSNFPSGLTKEFFYDEFQNAKRNKKGIWVYQKNRDPSYWRRLKKITKQI